MKALLIVDMQNDFMPGGALPVPKGNEIIDVIHAVIPRFSLLVITQDWHPKDHVSFAANHPGKQAGEMIPIEGGAQQILWPIHCVQNTYGADIIDLLKKESISKRFYKGTDSGIDGYSAFFDNAHSKSTGLGEYLKASQVDEVYLAGVATDYCILYSALDAVHLGLTVYVILDACRAINLQPGDEDKALQSMRDLGVHFVTSQNLGF